MDSELDFQTPRKVAKSLSRHLSINVAKKAIQIREQQTKLPPPMRNTIQELNTENDPQVFVTKVEDRLLDTIETIIQSPPKLLSEGQEKELEVALCFFPNLLWYPLEHLRISMGSTKYSEFFQFHNLIQVVPLVPLYCKLGVESGWYSEKERGGLMMYRAGVTDLPCKRLSLLEYICSYSYDPYENDIWTESQWEEIKREAMRRDQMCRGVMEGLREGGVFFKQDILDCTYLMECMTGAVQSKGMHIARQRYLLDWCPEAALAKIEEGGRRMEHEEEDEEAEVKKKLRYKIGF